MYGTKVKSSKPNYKGLADYRRRQENLGRVQPVATRYESSSIVAGFTAAAKLDATRHSTIIKYGTDQEVETGRQPRGTQAASGYPPQRILATPQGHGIQTRKATKKIKETL